MKKNKFVFIVPLVFFLFLFFIPADVGAVSCNGLAQVPCQADLACEWDLVQNICVVDSDLGAEGDDPCNDDGDCKADESCKAGACVAKTGVGDVCAAAADCKTGECDFGAGGNKICKCKTDEQCVDGKTCNSTSGLCEDKKAGGAGCDVDADCAAGNVCPVYEGAKTCRKKCATDAECGAEICFKNQYCVAKMKIGEPCAKESDCGVGKCMEGVCKDPAAFGGAPVVPAPVQPSSADMINDAIGKIDQLTPAEMNKSDDLASIVGKAISMILGIIGSAALLVFLYSGIMWMTSGGADKTIANAQKSMIWAAIGLFTVFFSYILVKYIITQAGA